jgi:hypothetical protein
VKKSPSPHNPDFNKKEEKKKESLSFGILDKQKSDATEMKSFSLGKID